MTGKKLSLVQIDMKSPIFLIVIVKKIIIVIIFSLSDRRSSGFCSDNEKSSGLGRHGWVEIMIIVGHG